MDLSKYKDDLTDVEDYLFELGFEIQFLDFEDNYRSYLHKTVDFIICIYRYV